MQPNHARMKFSADLAWAIERQLHEWRRTPQVIPPVVKLPCQPFPIQPTPLPHCVIRVLHRQLGKWIFHVGDTRAVDRREFPQQNLDRPVIANDVVHRQVQNVVVLGKVDHLHTPQRAMGKIEVSAVGHAETGIERRLTLVLRHIPQIHDREHARIFGRDHLHRATARQPK